MDLFILRHGKAEPSGPSGDSGRRLTQKGRDEVFAVAQWMAERGYFVDLIATSPLVRAKETAKIVAETLGPAHRVVVWKTLAPGGSPDDVCRDAAKWGDDARVLLVGHEPSLSFLISRIISGGDDVGIVMAKGGLAKIRNYSFMQRPSGDLQWLVTPKLIRGGKR
jgi:phosphohistidine phosphatase